MGKSKKKKKRCKVCFESGHTSKNCSYVHGSCEEGKSCKYFCMFDLRNEFHGICKKFSSATKKGFSSKMDKAWGKLDSFEDVLHDAYEWHDDREGQSVKSCSSLKHIGRLLSAVEMLKEKYDDVLDSDSDSSSSDDDDDDWYSLPMVLPKMEVTGAREDKSQRSQESSCAPYPIEQLTNGRVDHHTLCSNNLKLDAAAPGLAKSTPPIVLAKVNAEKYSKLASKYGVNGYPTLKFFINGFPVDYDGPRKAASLASHLQKLAYPDVKVLNDERELQDFLQTADDNFPFFLAFGLPKSSVSELAQKYKTRAWFLVVESFSDSTMELFDFDKSPAVVAQQPGHQGQEVYYGPFEGDELALFVQQNLLPRVNFLTAETMNNIKEDGRAIALAFLKDVSSEVSVTFIQKLRAAAPANRMFIFAYADALAWPSFVENFDINTQSALPTLVVWDGDSTYFVSSEGYDFTDEKADAYITFFLQEFKEGKASKRYWKGPSFTGFLKSLISVKTLCFLMIAVGVLVFALSSNTDETAKRHGSRLHDGEFVDDKQRSSSKLLGSGGNMDTASYAHKEE